MEFQNVEIIRLSEVLNIMDTSPEPFDIIFCTASGEIKEYRNCRMSGAGRKGEKAGAGTKKESVPVPDGKNSKNPHHFTNATRNLVKANGHIRKLHIFLILKFNDKKVII